MNAATCAQHPDGRTRLLQAALRLVATDGWDRTSLRRIAGEAGVTAPLVTHHFGTKAALRDAVDAWLLGLVAAKQPGDLLVDRPPSRDVATPAEVDQALASSYLARVLLDGGEPSASLLSALVSTTQPQVALARSAVDADAVTDPEMVAALVVILQLCSFAAADALRAALGVDLHTDEGLARWQAAVVELMVGGPLPG